MFLRVGWVAGNNLHKTCFFNILFIFFSNLRNTNECTIVIKYSWESKSHRPSWHTLGHHCHHIVEHSYWNYSSFIISNRNEWRGINFSTFYCWNCWNCEHWLRTSNTSIILLFIKCVSRQKQNKINKQNWLTRLLPLSCRAAAAGEGRRRILFDFKIPRASVRRSHWIAIFCSAGAVH